MSTRKILSLEEIEKMESNTFFYGEDGHGIKGLFATARAYWELNAILNDSPTLHKDLNN